jgi:glycosyltransferase involved in cell wall biosynthesis
MSRLALLVPARNAEAFLPRLLSSAAAQTEPFDDMVVYDDASSDATGAVARSYGASVVRSETNTGPSRGKNLLAEGTDCDWVHFHDADGALGPEFVGRARNWMEQDKHDVVLFATEDRDDETHRMLGRRDWDGQALAVDPVRHAIRETITNCGIYRRRRFLEAGGFDLDEAVKYNEDQAMHLRLALAGLSFGAEAYRGVVVYRRAHSMSADHPVECARAQVEVLARTAARTGRNYAREIGSRLWRLAGVCAGYSDWVYVRKCLDLAKQLDYLNPTEEHVAVRLMARVSPLLPVIARERFIRLLKPHLRRGMPSVARDGLATVVRKS